MMIVITQLKIIVVMTVIIQRKIIVFFFGEEVLLSSSSVDSSAWWTRRTFVRRLQRSGEGPCRAGALLEDVEAVAVESTFNWYWFADGLMENGYTVHLANPSAIQQYEGLRTSTTRGAPSGGKPPEARDPPRRLHLPEGNEAAKGISSGKRLHH